MPQRTLVAGLTILLHYLTALVLPQLLSLQPVEQLVSPLTGITVGLFLLYGHVVALAVVAACGLSLGLSGLTGSPELPASTLITYTVSTLVTCYSARCFYVLLTKLTSKKAGPSYSLLLLLVTLSLASLMGCISNELIEYVISSEAAHPAAGSFFLCWVKTLLGVLYFTHLTLIFKASPYLHKSQVAPRQALIGVCIYIFISVLFTSALKQNEAKSNLAFAEQTQPFIQEFLVAQTTIRNQLDAMQGLYKASKHVSRDEFRILSESIHSDDIAVRALGWIPRLEHAQRAAIVKAVRKEGFDSFEIKTVSRSGLVPAEPQAIYYPILYLEPVSPNTAALGLDVSTHPVVAATVKQAIQSKAPTVSPLITLAQQTNKATGLIVYHALYKQSQALPEGLFEVVFELDKIVNHILNKLNVSHYAVRVRYGHQGSTQTTSYTNTYSTHDLEIQQQFQRTVNVPFFDQTAAIDFFDLANTDQNSLLRTNWLAYIFGLLCGFLINLFFYVSTLFNRELSAQVEEKTLALRQANQKLKMANEAQSTFLATMSHEIRTPLNGIMGVFQILEKSKLPDAEQKLIVSGKTSSTTLLTILNDILDIAKIEAGKLKIETLNCDLNELMESTLAEFQPQARSKGISLDLAVDDPKNQHRELDPVRVKQILSNLLSNAIKFTEHGHVHVQLSSQDQGFMVEVSDTGIGMAQSALDRLFQRFEQADQSTTRRFGGTGLGMAITKQLVELMGGSVTVKSQPGAGTQFSVYLPSPLCEQQTQDTETGQLSTPELSNFTLLLAEDNLINQEIFVSLLEDTHATILIAQNGKEAVEMFQQHQPDMIFMDIQMPVMDGVDACKTIRQQDRNIPIVSVSANTYEEDVRTYFASGFNAHIAKPVELSLLYETLHRYLLNH